MTKPDSRTFQDLANWQQIADHLETLALRREIPELRARLDGLVEAYPSATDAFYLAAKYLVRIEDYRMAIEYFERLRELALRGALTRKHPATLDNVEAQLAVRKEDRIGYSTKELRLRKNLEALEEIQADMAERAACAPDSDALATLDIWGESFLADSAEKKLRVPSAGLCESMRGIHARNDSVIFFGVNCGTELLELLKSEALASRLDTRRAYLLEQDPSVLREFLRMADLTTPIRNDSLLVFTGPDWRGSFENRLENTGPLIFVGRRDDYFPVQLTAEPVKA